MTSMELFDILGNTRDSYVAQAQRIRSGEAPTRPKGLPMKRIWLIAAIIALTVLLVGCAVVYVMSLRDMKIGQYSVTEPSHYGPNWEIIEAKEKTYELISFQGYTNSTNQQAVKEWWECRKRWEWLDSADGMIPEGYYASYGCKNAEMIETLDGILEKYDLTPLGEGISVQRDQHQVLFDALKLDGICVEQTYAQTEYGSGSFGPEGNFHIRVNISLGEEFDWPYLVMADFRYSQREYFDYFYIGVENLNEFQEWEYTLPDGRKVLLALGEKDTLILAQQEDASISIHFDAKMGVDQMTKDMVEKIASLFDYSVVPQSLTEREVWEIRTAIQKLEDQRKQEAMEQAAQYAQTDSVTDFSDIVRETLESSFYDVADLGYAFYDIDGNGVDDLLIGRDGYCTAIYWEVDGQIRQFASAATNLFVCEDQTIGYVLTPWDTNYFFTRLDHGTSIGVANINYVPGHPEGEYRKGDLEHWNRYDIITKEEFDSIMNSYVRIPVTFLPLMEYPLEEAVRFEEKSQVYWESAESYEAIIRMRLTSKEEQWPRWKYDIRDLNDDGVEEMIWSEDGRICIYTTVDDTIISYNMVSDGSITLCEDGIVEAVHHYGPVNKTYRYYHLEADRAVLVDYLRYDVDANPEKPWFRSPDLTGQDITLENISTPEAMSIIASYDHLEIDMKPISEYPFN